jgi:hypothetical protein
VTTLVAGDADGGVVDAGGGLSAPFEAGGEGAGACVGRTGLGVASGFGFGVTAATGATEAGDATGEGASR